MMNMFRMSIVNLRCATYAAAVHTVDSMGLLRDNYFRVLLDGRHQQRSVKRFQEEDAVGWAAEPLPILYAFPVGGKPISPAQVIKLSRAAIIFNAIV